MEEAFLMKAISGLIGTLTALLWWLWVNDRHEQNARIEVLDKRVNDHESDRISRDEFNSLAASIRQEFRLEHSEIIAEVREGNRAITDRIDRLIEMRAKP
jgi:hypothetical protein